MPVILFRCGEGRADKHDNENYCEEIALPSSASNKTSCKIMSAGKVITTISWMQKNCLVWMQTSTQSIVV